MTPAGLHGPGLQPWPPWPWALPQVSFASTPETCLSVPASQDALCVRRNQSTPDVLQRAGETEGSRWKWRVCFSLALVHDVPGSARGTPPQARVTGMFPVAASGVRPGTGSQEPLPPHRGHARTCRDESVRGEDSVASLLAPLQNGQVPQGRQA